MYGEFFDIPQPDDLIFLGWFRGGEVFRSGCTFRRGHGKVFASMDINAYLFKFQQKKTRNFFIIGYNTYIHEI